MRGEVCPLGPPWALGPWVSDGVDVRVWAVREAKTCLWLRGYALRIVYMGVGVALPSNNLRVIFLEKVWSRLSRTLEDLVFALLTGW